ncbi:MAG: helix-turn-helix protein [Mucilaginibacter sp.]|nr:helix-turn-helix protein [Mucilaginibacter sp.]
MGYLKVLNNNNKVYSNVSSQRYQKPQTGDLSFKFVLSGEEKYSLGRRQLAIHPDSFLLINKGTEFTSTIESNLPVESFSIDFDQQFLQDFTNCLRLKSSQLLDHTTDRISIIDFDETIYPFKGDINYNIKHLKRHLDAGLQDELLINEYLHHSLVNYYNIYDTEIVKKSENLTFLNKSTKIEILRRLNLAKEYMLSNYNNSIDLDMIAKHSCLSVNHFLRTFKQAYCQSPYQFLTQVRLQRARILLKTTDYSVNEIVNLVGFECSSSFIRLFKSKYQITPSRFKIPA